MLILLGVFIILHGLVHLLYFGQASRLFELKAGLKWPLPSWVFSRFIDANLIRQLVSIGCVLVAFGLIAGGIGIIIRVTWWNKFVSISAVLSTILFILFWDGKLNKLHDKGLIGIFINVGVLCLAYLLNIAPL
jgi:hypothetical protein